MQLSSLRALPAHTEGAWFDYTGADGQSTLQLLLAAWDNKNHLRRKRELTQQLVKPGQMPDHELSERIFIEAMAETVILDIKGLMDGENPIAYSADIGKFILTEPSPECRHLRDFIAARTQSPTAHREALAAKAGEALKSSAGVGS